MSSTTNNLGSLFASRSLFRLERPATAEVSSYATAAVALLLPDRLDNPVRSIVTDREHLFDPSGFLECREQLVLRGKLIALDGIDASGEWRDLPGGVVR